ncbi:MAG: addiction module toxin RelE [Deltaproteobacteria bacterium]|nr:MAG: addiction module toxin RelE [Deltaproteobacteria bacterium]
MARPLRVEFDGAIYHVTSRGNAREDIFDDDGDRKMFLEVLGKVVNRFNWLCHAYCLMDNHYHMVIETPQANLSKGMRQLNGLYTQVYNRRHRTVGHLFQGRYKAVLIQKESHLLEVCRYVVLNPVRAKATRRVEQWKWSSYGGTAGLGKSPPWLAVDWVLSQFGKRRYPAARHYRRFVREGIDRPSIWEGVQAQVLLGEEEFVEKLKSYVKGYREIAEIPRTQRYLSRPKLKTLFEGKLTKAKRDARIVRAVHRHGYSQREVADFLDLHYATVSRLANRP